MTKFIACVLIMDDKEAIEHLQRRSLTVTEFTDLESISGQGVLAVGRAALSAMDLLNEIEVKLTGRQQERTRIPVLVFTAQDQETSKLERLNGHSGGRFTEPRAVGDRAVRRPNANHAPDIAPGTSNLCVRDLMIDRARRLVTLRNEEMHLTPTEYELLCLLAAHAGAVLTHEQLMYEIWGANDVRTVHLLRVNISNLRRKLDADPGIRASSLRNQVLGIVYEQNHERYIF